MISLVFKTCIFIFLATYNRRENKIQIAFFVVDQNIVS